MKTLLSVFHSQNTRDISAGRKSLPRMIDYNGSIDKNPHPTGCILKIYSDSFIFRRILRWIGLHNLTISFEHPCAILYGMEDCMYIRHKESLPIISSGLFCRKSLSFPPLSAKLTIRYDRYCWEDAGCFVLFCTVWRAVFP